MDYAWVKGYAVRAADQGAGQGSSIAQAPNLRATQAALVVQASHHGVWWERKEEKEEEEGGSASVGHIQVKVTP